MTYSHAADPIAAALLALVPPPTGWTAEATKAAPAKYEGKKIYCWILRQETKPAGMDGGEHVEAWFYARMAWSVGTDEESGQVRLATTSDAIDDGLAAIMAAVQATRVNEVWEWVQVDHTDPHAITTFGQRAGWVDLSGYRLV